jgi:hypothetical protein
MKARTIEVLTLFLLVGTTTPSVAVASPPAAAVRAGWAAGDCWEAYAAAAADAANTYADCYNNTSWYDVGGRLACSALYAVEAEGNWIGYLNCADSSTR